MPKTDVVMFSGGIGSWAAAKRVAKTRGTQNLTLLFTDTLIEDADLYRFLDEAAADVFGQDEPNLIKLTEGRSPWQVFRDERMIGNTRADPCSKILKRELVSKWISDHYTPETVTLYVGIDWTESHRLDGIRERRAPWQYEAPMVDPPYMMKADMLRWAKESGLVTSRMYDFGFEHDNCGGFCIKAGQGHFAMLLRSLPDVYRHHEDEEQSCRDYLGKDVAILRDRRGGKTRPLTLRELRERIEAGHAVQPEFGGCGCFVD